MPRLLRGSVAGPYHVLKPLSSLLSRAYCEETDALVVAQPLAASREVEALARRLVASKPSDSSSGSTGDQTPPFCANVLDVARDEEGCTYAIYADDLRQAVPLHLVDDAASTHTYLLQLVQALAGLAELVPNSRPPFLCGTTQAYVSAGKLVLCCLPPPQPDNAQQDSQRMWLPISPVEDAEVALQLLAQFVASAWFLSAVSKGGEALQASWEAALAWPARKMMLSPRWLELAQAGPRSRNAQDHSRQPSDSRHAGRHGASMLSPAAAKLWRPVSPPRTPSCDDRAHAPSPVSSFEGSDAISVYSSASTAPSERFVNDDAQRFQPRALCKFSRRHVVCRASHCNFLHLPGLAPLAGGSSELPPLPQPGPGYQCHNCGSGDHFKIDCPRPQQCRFTTNGRTCRRPHCAFYHPDGTRMPPRTAVTAACPGIW